MSATLGLVRHLSIRERVTKLSIVPATGLHSEKQHGFRRVPSKQGPPKRDLFSIFCLPSRAVAKMRAPKRPRYGRPYCCAYRAPNPRSLVIPSEARNLGFRWQLSRPRSRFPVVEIIWKFCGKRRLTGFTPHRMLVGFRGQSDSHLCGFAWTEFAPLRRTAIRSLTTRLNVPVVRNELGRKSERSHKIDHHGLQALARE